MNLFAIAPALPLHAAGKYVAGAYIVFVLVILIYVTIMAIRLGRTERALVELNRDLARREEASGEAAAELDIEREPAPVSSRERRPRDEKGEGQSPGGDDADPRCGSLFGSAMAGPQCPDGRNRGSDGDEQDGAREYATRMFGVNPMMLMTKTLRSATSASMARPVRKFSPSRLSNSNTVLMLMLRPTNISPLSAAVAPAAAKKSSPQPSVV